jgi:hypothetical protein
MKKSNEVKSIISTGKIKDDDNNSINKSIWDILELGWRIICFTIICFPVFHLVLKISDDTISHFTISDSYTNDKNNINTSQSIYGTYRNKTGEVEVSVSKTTWFSTLYLKNDDGVIYDEVKSYGKVIDNLLYPRDYKPYIDERLQRSGRFDGNSLEIVIDGESRTVTCYKVK